MNTFSIKKALIIFLSLLFLFTGSVFPPARILPGDTGLAYAKTRSRSAEIEYQQAKEAYRRLAASARLRKYRKNWISVINKFRKVYLAHPDDPEIAPKALFMMARCYSGLYGYSRRMSDIQEAIERYQVLVERFPNNRLADDALYEIGQIYKMTGRPSSAIAAWKRILRDYPNGSHARLAKERLARMGVKITAFPSKKKKSKTKAKTNKKGTTKKVAAKTKKSSSKKTTKSKGKTTQKVAIIKDIRYWSDTDYTRVVINSSRPVSIKQGELPADKKRGLPKRFYLDLSPAYKKIGLPEYIKIDNGLLRSVRAAQFQPRTVRVVFDLAKTEKIKVFYLRDPFRVVTDAFGAHYAKKKCAVKPKKVATTHKKKSGTHKGKLSLAQQLGLCVRTIVVDPGHGGRDPGARGRGGTREKDVVLQIAKRLAKILKKELHCRVIMTRRSDRYLPLTQRTAIANANKADLFISIHANAAPTRRLRGIETYFLNFALDEDAMRVAARENATSEKRIGELKSILNDILKNSKVNESSRLARKVQYNLVRTLKKRYKGIRNLGVKQAPFFVLIGARMPSILVETSFISNPTEERRLRSPSYQEALARGIAKGVLEYIRETQLAYKN
ncbi:MAG: tetratricopeptide repeat protein [Thermodesulfobacteria bacterium]|nr:tetratricopeptide repeat protein [Thermodesulfobacteriota bacterium]